MKAQLIVKNATQVVTSEGASNSPKIKEQLAEIRVIENGAIAVADGKIIAIGTTDDVMAQVEVDDNTEIIDATGRVILPGLVDSHTHVVFGGSRENELDLKLKGVSYLDILAQGGGIISTVKATRTASKEDLKNVGKKYLKQMLSQGTTTTEAKSGYGLTLEDEIKTLEAIKELNEELDIDLVPTFMGAHAVPIEYKEDREGYIKYMNEVMVKEVAKRNLAEFCDVFCEKGVFTAAESREILTAARNEGLKLKLHADEIEAIGGSQLAAELSATSADHLLVMPEESMDLMAKSGTVATFLPCTTLYLKEDHFAPARKAVEKGVPVAVATDFNPGSCPNNNLQLVMTISCLYLRLTPAEVINAMTINAAHAIGRANTVGSLEVGKKADIVLFDAPNYQYLPYRFGSNLVTMVIKNGKVACVNN